MIYIYTTLFCLITHVPHRKEIILFNIKNILRTHKQIPFSVLLGHWCILFC